MRGENRALLFLVSVGMELSWLYACVNFLMTLIFNHPFPFPESVGSLVLAAVLTLFSEGKGWRVIYVLALQALGFIPALLRMIHIFNSWSDSFLSQTWLIASPNNPAGLPPECLPVILILIWVFVFWAGGVRLAKRPMDYFIICSRFDRGLMAFFLLFLTKFLLQIKGGIHLEEPVSEFLLFPFLIFSLLAIGLIRNRSAAPKDFLPGFQGMGVILSFIVVILLFGTGLVLFCLPYLTVAAETGYKIVKIVSGPIGSVLVKVLRFIFGPTMALPDKQLPQKETSIPDLTSQGESSWWIDFFGKILTYGLWIVLGLFLLIIIGATLCCLYRWLLSRTAVSQERQGPWYPIVLWAERLRLFLHSCWRWLLRRMKGYEGAIQLYMALRTWGRYSGLPHSLSETPTEYGSRLKHRFPVLKREIEFIIEAFNETVYGEIILDENRLTTVQSAWHKLRSPLHWPLRLKSWFFRPR